MKDIATSVSMLFLRILLFNLSSRTRKDTFEPPLEFETSHDVVSVLPPLIPKFFELMIFIMVNLMHSLRKYTRAPSL